MDQVFGPNRLAARYSYTNNVQLHPEYYAPTEPDQGTSGGDNGSRTYTRIIGAHAVNVAHVGVQYNHNYSGPMPIPEVTDALGLPAYQNTVGWPSFYWSYSNGASGAADNYWVGSIATIQRTTRIRRLPAAMSFLTITAIIK